MGLLDRWLNRFLGDDDDEREVPESEGPAPEIPPAEAAAESDPLDEALQRARARLTLDEAGRRFAEGTELIAEVASLDAGGRSRAADALLADALLVNPSPALRRRLAERLLHRGERDPARALLVQLADMDEHAAFALTALGEIAEHKGDAEEALRFYERVLALDMQLEQAKARARRLRAGRESRRRNANEGRALLTRFLGARAAGSRYAVLEEIGRGGAATVFRARDRVVEREVALKIFHPRGRTTERRSRIVREARIAGSFDHPHIVPILDIDEGRDLLVMALCDGGSLRQRLSKGRLRTSETADIGAVLLRTLADIHEAGRVHFDIKPSNLLFGGGRLMLCDFGTAGLVELGAAAGTRAYMAPEQRRGQRAGPPADVYATGLLLFECLEGHLPPTQGGDAPPLSLASHPPGPRRRALERLLKALTAPAPAERHGDLRRAAEELLEAAALPATDKDGEALYERLLTFAAREGAEAEARLARHPVTELLRAPAGT